MELRGVELVLRPARQSGRTEDVADQAPVDEVCSRGDFTDKLRSLVGGRGRPVEKYIGKTEELVDLLAWSLLATRA